MVSERPMLSSAHKNFLKEKFPGEDCLLTPEESLVFGADASRLFSPPLAVVRPTEIGQVQELLKWADKEKMPIYTRGRGTNVVGDCVPDPPGVVVSTLKMNRILEVNRRDFIAVVQPGVVTSDLQAVLAKEGLFYPPDPASVRISSIGGNVATGAGGLRAVKYGVTRDYVLGLTTVLPGGEVVRTGGRTHKNVVGLDLTRLMVGSEGSLGFIADVTLKLLPLPERTASLMAGYDSMDKALTAADAVFASGMLPVVMEFMADEALRCLALAGPVPWPKSTRAVLLLGVDGGAKAVEADLARLRHAAESAEPLYLDQGMGKEEEEPLWELRRLINPASFLLAPDKSSDDVTVPRGSMREATDGIREIGERLGLTILVFGHLGDGNLHVNIMHDASNLDIRDKVQQAKEKIQDLTLKLRGSLSGEHGVGLTKAPYVHKQLDESQRRLMRDVKHAFDPNGIMNPGKGF